MQTHSGWLWKRENALLARFERLWVVLQARTLTFFRDGSKGAPALGWYRLPTNTRCFSTTPQRGLKFCFRVAAAPVQLLLAARSARERNEWVGSLTEPYTPPLKRVLFLYGRGGGGHKASADAVHDCLLNRLGVEGEAAYDVTMKDIGKLLETPVLGSFVERLFNWIGMPGGDDVYNLLMSRGWYRWAAVCCVGCRNM